MLYVHYLFSYLFYKTSLYVILQNKIDFLLKLWQQIWGWSMHLNRI
jgi:hypothetical protein